MYCDQPSLLTRDPGGGVNEEIPHRWAKQPPRKNIEQTKALYDSTYHNQNVHNLDRIVIIHDNSAIARYSIRG